MSHRSKHGLTGLLAGLLVLALLGAPAQHARMTVARATFALAYALPDGTLPDLCAHRGAGGKGGHPPVLGCLACVLMTAPGLAAPPQGLAARLVRAEDAAFLGQGAPVDRQTSPARASARAPPAWRIA